MSYSKEDLIRYRVKRAKELVKTGRIDREDGILFNRLFSMRQQADYEDFMDLQEEDILPLLPRIKLLIREIEDIIIEEQES